MSSKIKLSEQDLTAFGSEIDAIKQQALADVGERDAKYIRRLTKIQRNLAFASRITMYLSLPFLPVLGHAYTSWPLFWLLIGLGAIGLGVAKILDNMEIGHNVMHGQYDWMGDPQFHSGNYDWDTVCPAEQWKHSHNYRHHTYTNILDKDRDIGYGILRIDDEQKWSPGYLGNPLYAFLLMMFFDMGVALHDVEFDEVRKGNRTLKEALSVLRKIGTKTRKIWTKDFLLFPLLAGPFFPVILLANAVANLIRNIWSFSIIFCGHFPEGVHIFTEEECENETQGHWYYRQLLGSANIKGGKLFHIMSGNLSHQVEHHLFPDVPAHRYAEMAVEVQQVCQRYNVPYNTGSLAAQLGSVWLKIFRLALPSRNPSELLPA